MDPTSLDDRPSVETAGMVIGRSIRRVDGRPKVTGAARFAADIDTRGLLHGRPVLSLPAHAMIDRIDASAALAVPGVVAVLTAADLPIAAGDDDRDHQPLARREILWAGQPVALVVATTPEAAADAAPLVVVETTPLDAVLDIDEAMAPGAPRARFDQAPLDVEPSTGSQHAAVGGGAEAFAPSEPVSDNVTHRTGYRRGDVVAAMADSDVVVDGSFTTEWVHQGYIEPQVVMAELDRDGVLHLTCATQGTFFTRSQVARLYDLPINRVRVTGATIGGAFGGKVMILEPLVAGAALALRRPVRVELTRLEDFRMTDPAPAVRLDLRIGAQRDGRLRAIQARIRSDTGAFGQESVEGIVAILTLGAYRWETHEIVAFGIETNRVPAGAYRAPGAPQASFAIEQVLDELAQVLRIDPIELRRRNLARPDDEMADGTAWGNIGLDACLTALEDHPLYRDRASLPDDEGVGVAAGAWPGGRQSASAICRLEADGRISVVTGVVDISGSTTGFATIAAAGLGLDPADITVISADTASAPRSPLSGGSVVTYSTGRAVQGATAALRDKILAYAAQTMEIDARDLEIADGAVRPRGTPERRLTLAEIGRRVDGFNSDFEPLEGHGGTVPPGLAPLTSAHLVHVRVDRETGLVEVLGYVLAQDVGRALNPAIIEGQLHGGATQGLGWALYESLIHDPTGQLATGTFLDYALQTAGRVPTFETIIVEVPSEDGPYGARGIGEGPVCGAAAAVANAVADATGVRFRSMPITPQAVWRGVTGSGPSRSASDR